MVFGVLSSKSVDWSKCQPLGELGCKKPNHVPHTKLAQPLNCCGLVSRLEILLIVSDTGDETQEYVLLQNQAANLRIWPWAPLFRHLKRDWPIHAVAHVPLSLSPVENAP